MRAILTYHSIDPSGSVISMEPAVFRRQMEWLAASSIRVLPLRRLVEEPELREAVALTFDDAFANFATLAWPVLRDLELPATVFVPTDHVGGHNDWASTGAARVPRLELLDWGGVERIAREGAEIGSHTRRHPDLRALDADRIEDEVTGAADELEARTGTRPESFAYPFGCFDGRTARAVGGVYAFACTTELRPLKAEEDPVRLPRLDMFYYRRPGALEAWGRATFHGRLRVRALARRIRETAQNLVSP